MPATIRDRLVSSAPAALFGREAELAMLRGALAAGTPSVLHLHGLSGGGKSALIAAFAAEARAQGASVLAVDCSAVEPTQRGFLAELSRGLGCEGAELASVVTALAALPPPLLLTLDTCEVFGLLDAWLRQVFVPALPDRTLVLIGSRLPPASAWVEPPEWHDLFRAVPLGPLPEAAAAALLDKLGVRAASAKRIQAFAAGHPLALILAARASQAALPAGVEQEPLDAVIHQLAQRFLGDIAKPETREGLRAACVVRRVSRGLLRALLPEADAAALYEGLAALPFVSADRDGLAVHDAVREALSADLQAADPELHRRWRQQAWRYLSAAARAAPSAELWRRTADLIHLIRNPVIREAFFPRDAARFAVEPARPTDRAGVLDIVAWHDGAAGAALLAEWLEAMPGAFFVARGAEPEVAGFYCLFDPAEVPAAMLLADPVTAGWCRDLEQHPIPGGQTALFLRRWLGRAEGERPSPVQAACWLDIKRHYMERRPRLRRVYIALHDAGPYAAAAATLGIAALPEAGAMVGEVAMGGFVLDMGAGSMDGWLARLAAGELGVESTDGVLDHARRALRVDGQLVPLTRREFEVIAYLAAREGEAVSRDGLIADVWGLRFDPGSNVVDAVIAGLRRKLGLRAGAIETVRSFGYRYRASTASGVPR